MASVSHCIYNSLQESKCNNQNLSFSKDHKEKLYEWEEGQVWAICRYFVIQRAWQRLWNAMLISNPWSWQLFRTRQLDRSMCLRANRCWLLSVSTLSGAQVMLKWAHQRNSCFFFTKESQISKDWKTFQGSTLEVQNSEHEFVPFLLPCFSLKCSVPNQLTWIGNTTFLWTRFSASWLCNRIHTQGWGRFFHGHDDNNSNDDSRVTEIACSASSRAA